MRAVSSLSRDAMSARRPITTALFVALLFPACSTGPELDIKIDESPHGAVYLKRISERSFQAAHPIKIDPTIIALVLNGILIRDDQDMTRDVRRVFSGSEVGYLAPIISDGFRRAAPDQQVAFKAGQIGEPNSSQRGSASDPSPSSRPQVSASGLMYAYGRSLYVTLTQYRSRQEAATTTANANATVTNHTVSFIPEAARRADSFLDSRSTGHTLVIDWELLAMLPEASSVPASTKSSSAPASPQAVNGETAEPVRKDAEIEALRKELQEIKKQLAEQQAERARSQPQPTVPQR